MGVQDFEQLIRGERNAQRFILSYCKNIGKLHCPSCATTKLYKIEQGKRRRCAQCGYTFHLLTGRWLDRVKLSARQWLWVVKLFELNAPVSTIAKETGISYPTALKAVNTIRMAITTPVEGKTDGISESLTSLDIPVFGVTENQKGIERMEQVPRERIALIIHIEKDPIIFTDRKIKYTTLICRNQKIKVAGVGRQFPKYRVYCNLSGFWPYAKERLAIYHGVSLARLSLYLKEIGFRWLNKDKKLLDLIIARLCDYAPNDLAQNKKSLKPINSLSSTD